MTNLDTPPDAAEIYDARAEVPLARPITQGDVFCGVDIPGFDEAFPAVIITQHPCSMRAGTRMRDRITVTAVRKRQKIQQKDWLGNASAMLLPKLLEGDDDFQADFRDSGSVKTTELRRASRIAALTNYGVQILHQRSIYYHTRLTVDIKTLAETYEPIATELELQCDWVESMLQFKYDVSVSDDTLEVIAVGEKEFGDYLDSDDRALRKKLQYAISRADVRRQVRREMMRRYGGQLFS
jgi:hypothetical protein